MSSIYTISASFISIYYSYDTNTDQYMIHYEKKYDFIGGKVNGNNWGVTINGKRLWMIYIQSGLLNTAEAIILLKMRPISLDAW